MEGFPSAFSLHGIYLKLQTGSAMSYKEIMVHIDCSQQYLNRLELAIQIAGEQQAHLTGLCVITHQFYKPELEGERHRLAEAEELFRLKTANANLTSQWLCADWQVTGVGMSEIVNYYAHFHDLTIVGQTSRESKSADLPRDLPERVVLGSGRPVLVVPFAGSFNSMGSRVIVAWKAGRSSARAVNDALPFLINAKQVCLLEIRVSDSQEQQAVAPKGDIAAYLRSYGINVKEENLFTGNIPVANILMNYAWENGCDMIVMGAYSNSSRGTVNLGAVADQMLDHMTLPVLMSY